MTQLEFKIESQVRTKVTTYNVHYLGLFYGCVIRTEDLSDGSIEWQNDVSAGTFDTKEDAAREIIGPDWQGE